MSLQVETPKKSVMLRRLSGEIYSWDRSSEQVYGFSRDRAVGVTSHRLLRTVFPQPLERINASLVAGQGWRGELIHTRSDGAQLKVVSTWEVIHALGAAGVEAFVRETNELFTPVAPENAQLQEPTLLSCSGASRRALPPLLLRTVMISLMAILLVAVTVWFVTHHHALSPVR